MVNDTNRDCDAACERADAEDGIAAEGEAAPPPETPPNLLQVIRRLILEGDG